MNGPDHYREAEGLLVRLKGEPMHPAQATRLGAAAQTHATLAVAAALVNLETNSDSLTGNALDTAPGVNWNDDRTAWKDVLK